MVISAITMLYLVNVEQTVVQWYFINTFFGMTGQQKAVVYTYAIVGPSWSHLVTNINVTLLGTIADSLLVRTLALWLFLTNYLCRSGGAIIYGTTQSS